MQSGEDLDIVAADAMSTMAHAGVDSIQNETVADVVVLARETLSKPKPPVMLTIYVRFIRISLMAFLFYPTKIYNS